MPPATAVPEPVLVPFGAPLAAKVKLTFEMIEVMTKLPGKLMPPTVGPAIVTVLPIT